MELLETENLEYRPFCRLTKTVTNTGDTDVTYTLTVLIVRNQHAATPINELTPIYNEGEVYFKLSFLATEAQASNFSPVNSYEKSFTINPENYDSVTLEIDYNNDQHIPSIPITSSKKSKIRLADAEIGSDTLNPPS